MTHCIYGSDKCPLNPEPTDVQRAIWRRHHKKGTSPGNPKWYRAASMPKPRKFKPGQPPVYPKIESGQAYRRAHLADVAPDPFRVARGEETVAGYVAAFDKACGFKAAR